MPSLGNISLTEILARHVLAGTISRYRLVSILEPPTSRGGGDARHEDDGMHALKSGVNFRYYFLCTTTKEFPQRHRLRRRDNAGGRGLIR